LQTGETGARGRLFVFSIRSKKGYAKQDNQSYENHGLEQYVKNNPNNRKHNLKRKANHPQYNPKNAKENR